jgi:sterol desaturase/sphingolipid hydroxylase (fatty acid hydroxylase superfamily)
MSGILMSAFTIAAGLTALERLRGVRGTDWVNNIAAWALQLGAAVIFLPLLPHWLGLSLIEGSALPFWLGFAIFFVAADLGEYLYHRSQHRVPFLWAMHSLHHSDPNMTALTTVRHFWGDQLIKQLTIWSAVSLVIAPTPAIAAAYGVVGLWNLVVHSALPIDLGRWSWLINSPVYHRRHHSRLPEHYDSNFAAILPIFDVIAGSYHRGRGLPPTGLDRRPENIADAAVWPLLFSGRWLRLAKRASHPAG